MSKGTTIFLVRHASTQWNEEGRWQCMDDKPISDMGIKQADAAAGAFKRIASEREIAAVFCSPLRRARETAERIAGGLGLTIEEEPLLREFNCGSLSGLDFAAARERYAGFYSRLETNWLDERYPEGETHREYAERCVLPALDELAGANPGKSVIAVTHGGFINTAVVHVIGSHQGRPLRKLSIDNCSYCELEVEPQDGERPTAGRVISLNITAHLRVAGLMTVRRS